MALIAAIWSGSCMKERLGTELSNKVQVSRRVSQGAPESPVIFTMVTELALRDLVKSWKVRNLAWSLDDIVLAAICCADDVVLAAASAAAVEVTVTERSGFDSWRRVNTLDKTPEDGGRKHCGGWLGCIVGRGAGTCGIEGVFGWKSAARDCAHISTSEQVLGELANRLGFIMAPEETALQHREIDNVAGFSVELERVDDGESPKRPQTVSSSHARHSQSSDGGQPCPSVEATSGAVLPGTASRRTLCAFGLAQDQSSTSFL